MSHDQDFDKWEQEVELEPLEIYDDEDGGCAEGVMYAILISAVFYFFVWQAIVRPFFN